MDDVQIKIERSRRDFLSELLSLLERLLDFCLCCVTCGCYRRQRKNGLNRNGVEYDTELLENEKDAVRNLLVYMDTELHEVEATINEERLRALCTLTYSDNPELQRSAALCYAEISERMRAPLTEPITRPLVELLCSRDELVQKTATLSVSNFALNGPAENKEILIACRALPPLVRLLESRSTEVQCNTCGCITTLATSDANKRLIVSEAATVPLLMLLQSMDVRVRRNAAGALLNLTHLQSTRNDLVANGAIPVIINVLQVHDHSVQYYCTAALSNLAINENHRFQMIAVGHYDVIRTLIKLLTIKDDRIKCQACYALRNLASEGSNQIKAVMMGVLQPLRKIIRAQSRETIHAAVACLRNLSIHKENEIAIISEGFLDDVRRVLTLKWSPDAQRHAAGTLRNLAVGNNIRAVVDSGCVRALALLMLDMETRTGVLVEITAALAVLADEDDVKQQLVQMESGRVFYKLVSLASLSSHSDIQYNSAGTIGQLTLVDIPVAMKEANKLGIILYIDKFLKSPEPNFQHIALWTLVQLLKDELFVSAVRDHHIDVVLEKLSRSREPPAIAELVTTVREKLTNELASSRG